MQISFTRRPDSVYLPLSPSFSHSSMNLTDLWKSFVQEDRICNNHKQIGSSAFSLTVVSDYAINVVAATLDFVKMQFPNFVDPFNIRY